jgi:hypothetical protein
LRFRTVDRASSPGSIRAAIVNQGRFGSKNRLRYFVLVARTGSFDRAATELHNRASLGWQWLNAVYHATGKRIREFPIRIETLLEA